MAEDRDDTLAALIQEYHRRVARGEHPVAEDFREAAGDCFSEFAALIEQERLFDEAMTTERFPRAFGNHGEYTLVERLGAGGIGIVYKAIQRSISRPVALKVLRGGWAGDEQLLQRFLDGARKAAQIEHDHVVHIYDSGVFQGRPYIAMQYVPGATLGEVYARLRKVGPPPFHAGHHEVLSDASAPTVAGNDTTSFVRRLAQLLVGPADALGQYHEAGIVHRDVKPGNLILHPQGRLVLTDFDLAKDLDTSFSKIAASKVGTPGYMSPEQIDLTTRDVDGRADVYSLGVVFYEGMTQRTPFKEEGKASRVYERTLTERAPDPARIAPALPADACKVVLKALERERRDRFPTMPAMAKDLIALAGGRPVEARPLSLSKRLSRRVWGCRWVLAAVLILVVATVIWRNNRPAILHIDPWPGGETYIDGEWVGTGPLKGIRRAPGAHDVAIRKQGFKEYRITVNLEPGSSTPLNPRLQAVEPSSPDALRAWEEILGIHLVSPEIERARGPGAFDGPVLPLRPRGSVRREDVALLAAEMSEPFCGRVLILEEAGGEVYAAPVQVSHRDYRKRLRDIVIDGLVAGHTYRWGFELPSGERVLAAFTVVPDLPDGTLASLRSRFPDEDARLARLFEIALLQRHGLDVAALEAAIELADEWPKRVVHNLAWQSLARLGLEGSSIAAAVYRGYVEAGN